MCTLYERITSLCESKGVSGSRMCLDLGLSKSTLSDIKSGRKKGVSTATAAKIATYFDVSVGYLLGEEDNKKPADQKADGLRGTGYYDLTPENRAMIDSLIDSLLRSQSAE